MTAAGIGGAEGTGRAAMAEFKLVDSLYPGARVFVAGHTAESQHLFAELAERPEAAAGVEFIGASFPGVGRGEYLSVHPEARQVGFFMSPALRAGIAVARARLIPLDYPGIWRHLVTMAPVDVAIVQVSSPDAQGWCSGGVCNDFAPAVWTRARRRVLHVNPRMPATNSSFRVRPADADVLIEAEAPLVTVDTPVPGEADRRIGESVATLVRDDDTVQLGIGGVPTAVLGALAAHRRLRVHSGMISEPVRGLAEAGALVPGVSVVTGMSLGDESFYDFVAHSGIVRLEDASVTHDVRVIARHDRFVAINSAMQVDLFGQVNSEAVESRLHAGPGGLHAFVNGALLAREGRSMICLHATARGGKVSRVVARLDATSVCSLPRFLADVIITEYGVAQLRGLSVDERAEALIAIAAPAFRNELAAAWADLRKRY